MEKLVSTVIPIYNTETYLPACLDSVRTQSYTALEIILADDGSADSGSRICDEYALSDSRVIVVHKKNGGVSETRNVGIRASKGDYLYFCDSDDLLNKDIIKTLTEMQKQQEDALVMCSISTFDTESEIETKKTDDRSIVCYEDRDEIFRRLSYNGYPVNKLFRADLVKSNGILFDKELTILEDQIFVYRYGNLMKSLRACPAELYYYRNNSSSLMHTSNEKRALSTVKARYFIFLLFKELHLSHDLIEKSWNDALLKLQTVKKDIFLKKITVSPENRDTLREIENALLAEKHTKRSWRAKDYFYYLFLK